MVVLSLDVVVQIFAVRAISYWGENDSFFVASQIYVVHVKKSRLLQSSTSEIGANILENYIND